ncbi:MAG: V-type ATP synthase subunit E family protein [Bacillota bacterium]|nr:V-type ATP synthase subunit E family protein [Bacillota bacterium]
MSNIDNITNKIQAEAEEKIAAINADKEVKLQAIRSEIIDQANLEKNKILSSAKSKADNIFSRISENAEIRIRDQRLRERQKLIDRVFDLALDRLNSISDEEFIGQVSKALESIGSDELVIRLEKSRLEAVKNSNLKVKVDQENFVENGFVLIKEKMAYNFKYDDILNDSRNEIGPELIKFLLK